MHQAWERFDVGSEQLGPHERQQHYARYRFASAFVAGKSILDMACGTGYGTALLKDHGSTLTCGVDLSDTAIEYARKTFGDKGIDFQTGNAEKIALTQQFGVITSFETIEHLQDPDRFLSGLTTLLAPGGTVIISTPVRTRGDLNTQPANPFHVREWSVGEFKQLLERYFQEVTMRWQFELRKYPLPYSRTLQRKALAMFDRKRVDALDEYAVQAEPPATHVFIPCVPSYSVGLCRLPKA